MVGAEPPPVLVRQLGNPRALVGVPVVPFLLPQPRTACRLDKELRQRASVAVRCDRHRPVATAARIPVLAEPALLLPKNGRDLAPAPTGGARLDPFVEVSRMAPLVDHGVHVRRAAQHLPARREDPSAHDRRLRLRFEVPVVVALEELCKCGRNRNEATRRWTPCLDQEYAQLSRVRQPLGQNAPRGTRANHDHVEELGRIHGTPRCLASPRRLASESNGSRLTAASRVSPYTDRRPAAKSQASGRGANGPPAAMTHQPDSAGGQLQPPCDPCRVRKSNAARCSRT